MMRGRRLSRQHGQLAFNSVALLLPATLLAWHASTGAGFAWLFSLATLGLLLRVCGTWGVFFLCWSPLLLLAPVQVWYLLQFGEPIDDNALLVAWTSTLPETIGFFSLLGLWLPTALALLAWALYVYNGWQLRWVAVPQRLGLALFVLSPLLLLVTLVYPAHRVQDMPPQLAENMHNYLASTFPFGQTVNLAGATVDAARAMGFFARHHAYGSQLSANVASNLQPQTHVLIIGESARYASFAFADAARQRQSPLSGVPGLQWLRGVYANANLTFQAVPMLMTGLPAASYRVEAVHGSLLDAASEAGYYTAWLSNQELYVAQVFSPHPDLWCMPSDLQRRGWQRTQPDSVLLACLQRALAAPAARKLIVLHTYGSHWDYLQRLPATERARYASLPAAAAYQRSIELTETLIRTVIDTVARQPGLSTVSYIPDHGEALLAEEGYSGHGYRQFALAEYHVPWVLWANPAAQAAAPQQWQQLQTRTDQCVTQDMVFHTLASLLGLQFAEYDARRDLTSVSWQAAPLQQATVLAGGEPNLLHNARDWSAQAVPCLAQP